MVGLPKVICPPIARCLSLALLLVFLFLALGGGGASYAQSTQDIRVEWAAQYPDGAVQLHISAPRGQTLDSVTVNVDGTTTALDISPEPLPVAQWFVLDASGGMLNIYPRVGAALERFLQGNPASAAGLIFYDDAVEVTQLTDQFSDLNAVIETYTATANAPGCLGDALTALADSPPDPTRARRVLLVAGPLSRQGPCQADPVQASDSPIDAIIIADDVDDAYRDVVESTGGQLREANLNTIQARFNEVRTLWTQPVYAVTGSLPPNTADATARVTLENGQSSDLPLRFLTVDAPEESAANPTPPSDGGLVIEAVATEAPSATPTILPSPSDEQPSETGQVASPVPAQDATATPTVTPSPTPDSDDTTAESAEEVLAEEAATEDATTESVAATHENTATETPEPDTSQATDSAPPPDAAPPSESETSATTDDPDEGLNPLILIGGGLVALAVVLLLAYVLVSGRNNAPQPQPPLSGNTLAAADVFQDVTDYEPTLQEASAGSPYDFYASAGATPLSRRTASAEILREQAEMAYQPTDMLSEDDEMLVTEMLSDEDFIQMRQQSRHEVVAWLRRDSTPPQHIEVYAPGVLIGRRPTCDVVIEDDKAVSGEHVRLEWHDDHTMWITTISTTNPAMVSGLVLPPGESRPLNTQDVIQLTPNTRLVYIQRTPDDATPFLDSDNRKDGPPDEDIDPDGVTQL